MVDGHVSDVFADMILEAVLTRDVSNLPTSYFFGLTLELPTDQNGSGLVEPAPAEYSRVEVAVSDASWVSAGAGSRLMMSEIDILYATAVTDWGNIRGYSIYDSLVDGVFLGFGLLNPYTITAGMTARLPAGAISVRLP